MGKFTGHRCDRDGCSTAEENPDPTKNTAPPGWIIVNTQSPDGKNFEYCSARCVKLWATERERAEKGTGKERGPDPLSPEGRAAVTAGIKRRWHNEGSHDAEPDPECPACIEATAPPALSAVR